MNIKDIYELNVGEVIENVDLSKSLSNKSMQISLYFICYYIYQNQ